jgi:hypothetical protein
MRPFIERRKTPAPPDNGTRAAFWRGGLAKGKVVSLMKYI